MGLILLCLMQSIGLNAQNASKAELDTCKREYVILSRNYQHLTNEHIDSLAAFVEYRGKVKHEMKTQKRQVGRRKFLWGTLTGVFLWTLVVSSIK